GIPCMGVVENMALHICSKCGHSEAIFGSGGGESIASEYAVPLLGSLPLDPLIREGLDRGQPIVACSPGSAIATQYVSIARQLAVQVNLAANSSTQSAAPEIIISED
ncbi:MAG: Mrp/NBP35 family ATP-binding protein, partial [Gammaproteobacteria bacterium]|nr:Mrp/NBP35 family ATP-binding protein [Gammaproteobacteria bacterium]